MCGSTVVLYRVYKKVDPFKVKLAAPRTNLTALNALNKGAVSYFTHMLLRITNLKTLAQDFTNAQAFFVSACEQATSWKIKLVN